MRIEGVLKQDGEDRYEVSSGIRNVVETGTYELVVGVPTRNGTIYEPMTKTIAVAETGETTVEVEVTPPPRVYATFWDGEEKQPGTLVYTFEDDQEVFRFRALDTIYVEPGRYAFRATPNAENELSVTETIAEDDFKEVRFQMVHTVHVLVKMVASGSGQSFGVNYELWQGGEKKYLVHQSNGAQVLPGTYDVILPHRIAPYHHGPLEITQEQQQRFEMTVPVGHATFKYEKADGTPDDDDRCFLTRLGPEPVGERGLYTRGGTPIPLRPGRYSVSGWRQKGTYDPVEFEIQEGEDKVVVLRDKG